MQNGPIKIPALLSCGQKTFVFGSVCSVGQLNDALFTKLVGKAGCRKNCVFALLVAGRGQG